MQAHSSRHVCASCLCVAVLLPLMSPACFCCSLTAPHRYQAVSPASTDLDRRPPRPRKDSRVRLFRTARWEAYVAGFSGFATPPRWAWGGLKSHGPPAVGVGTGGIMCMRYNLQPTPGTGRAEMTRLPPCQVCVRVRQAGAHADLAPGEVQVGHSHPVRVRPGWAALVTPAGFQHAAPCHALFKGMPAALLASHSTPSIALLHAAGMTPQPSPPSAGTRWGWEVSGSHGSLWLMGLAPALHRLAARLAARCSPAIPTFHHPHHSHR